MERQRQQQTNDSERRIKGQQWEQGEASEGSLHRFYSRFKAES